MSVTPADLLWWLRLASRVDWTWARTYAETAPHDYVVLGRTDQMSREDFVRAAHVIHTFGEPGRFHRSTNIYLTHGRHRWWTMDEDLDRTDLVNRAVNDRVYGVQDAPRTYSAAFTDPDAVATRYCRDTSGDAELVRRVRETFGEHQPRTLDVGCGTGGVLDLGVTVPQRYTGVDPSQAMLNRLVRAHPDVARVIPARFGDVHPEHLAETYELVVVDASLGHDVDRERLRQLCSGLLITNL